MKQYRRVYWRGTSSTVAETLGGEGMGVDPTKGVRPSTTLAWPGYNQPDIAVEVDTARLETSWFKKCCVNCVLLYYPSTEFKSALNVYWHGEGAAGFSCTELSNWEFPFLRMPVGREEYDIVWMGCPRRKPWKMCVHLYAFISHLSFNFLCLLLLLVSISVILTYNWQCCPGSCCILISFTTCLHGVNCYWWGGTWYSVVFDVGGGGGGQEEFKQKN